ncbi:MAG: sigma-54 dependent transcriptional regulator [Pseudomonadota bacterium]
MGLEFEDPILLVEDTPSLSMVYRAALERSGLKVTPVYRARDARAVFRESANRIVLLDLMLPDGDGLDILREINRHHADTKVIVITANGSINRAVQAMRGGAFDFLVKPFDDRRLLSAVENAVRSLEIEAKEPAAVTVQAEPRGLGTFVGSSPQMQQIYQVIQNIARSTATVFITGESGTGKEIAAQQIHSHSNRRSGPFVPINCGAIPRGLLESEVFGHLKGSFTGAISDKLGAAAAADGGTLFLDEICEMDLALQTKLLRFLQTSMIQPVGAVEARKVDVRIVCATNREPLAEVQAGRFREDLFYRLHVVPIELPPLRERGADVIEIAETLLARFSAEEGKGFRRIDSTARELLRDFDWPGNVRQLENVLRNAIVLNEGETLTASMLPRALMADAKAMRPRPPSHVANGHIPPDLINACGAPADVDQDRVEDMLKGLVGATLAEVEREFIEVTIRQCDGSIPRAARILDVSPSTLYRKREAWERSAS